MGTTAAIPKPRFRAQEDPVLEKAKIPAALIVVLDFLTWHRLYMVQLDELMEPWLAGTNLGLPYWDWTKHCDTIPDLWEGISSFRLRLLLFFVYRFTTDGEKIAHLPKGVERQQYGDLLDNYTVVKGYCGRYVIDNLCWNLGHTSICRETTLSGNTTVQRKSEAN